MSRAVVVTRPVGQGEPLAARLVDSGHRAWVVPALAIEPLPLADAHRRLLFDLDLYHAVFFVSANAAHHALRDCLCRTFLQSPVGISNDTNNAMKERHAKELSALDDSIPDVSSSVLAFVGLLWFQIL